MWLGMCSRSIVGSVRLSKLAERFSVSCFFKYCTVYYPGVILKHAHHFVGRVVVCRTELGFSILWSHLMCLT